MSTVTICIGSNLSPVEPFQNRAAFQINKAKLFIRKQFPVFKDTGIYPSDPERSATSPYCNCVIIIGSKLDYNQLHTMLKEYESRERALLQEPGHVTIDIDIVIVDNEIVRPLDFSSAYFRKGLEMLGAE